ncbi:MAG: hypothetical protein B6U77_02645 [Candidatus Hecatellales archaeon ex4484_218]|nr:MAG: hypothetical protein B6U77_02645 [Candidatus Hecatellales archaeon ex4484_218]
MVKAVFDYVSKLEGFGVEWEEFSLPTLNYALPTYYLIAMSEASSNLARFDGVRYGYRVLDENLDWNQMFSKTRREGFGSEVKRRIILGTYALSAGYYDKFFLKSLKSITLIKKEFEEAFKKFDVLIGPTMPVLPFKLGEKIDDPLALYLCDIDTVPANLTGTPSITFPCSFQDGLPIGIQIMAPFFKENLLLKISYASETFLQFNRFKPKI